MNRAQRRAIEMNQRRAKKKQDPMKRFPPGDFTATLREALLECPRGRKLRKLRES